MEPFSAAAAAVFYGLQSLFGGSPPPQTTDYGIPVGPGTEIASGEFEVGGLMAQTTPTPGTILPPWQFDVPTKTGLPEPIPPVRVPPSLPPPVPPQLPTPNVGPPLGPLPPMPVWGEPGFPWGAWILRGLGVAGGVLWPSEIGEEWPPGTFPYDVGGTSLPRTPTPGELDTIAGTPGPPDWWEREAERELARQAADQQRLEDEFRRASASAPAPAPAPAPSTSTPAGPRLWPWIGLGLGGAALLSRSSSTNVSSFTDPLSVGALTSIEDALLGFAQQGQAQPVTLVGGSGWGSPATSSQYCEPRPRGPRRKCLQRAPVRYSGGPRKGKAAGTKCIRFSAAK